MGSTKGRMVALYPLKIEQSNSVSSSHHVHSYFNFTAMLALTVVEHISQYFGFTGVITAGMASDIFTSQTMVWWDDPKETLYTTLTIMKPGLPDDTNVRGAQQSVVGWKASTQLTVSDIQLVVIDGLRFERIGLGPASDVISKLQHLCLIVGAHHLCRVTQFVSWFKTNWNGKPG